MATSSKTSRQAKSASLKRKKSTKKRGKHNRTMPAWIRHLLTIGVIAFFSCVFYFFFIRPYAYRWKRCPGHKEYGVCIPCGYQVHGLDISHYQGKIDWAQLALNKDSESPIHFIFLKATEGGDHSDSTFQRNFFEAGQNGFIRGAYHYFIPNTDPLKQADFFISIAKLDSGDLPPVLDVETTGRKNKKDLQRALRRWLDRVEAHYNVKPILYTSYKFKMKYLNDASFDAYPYWIAHYYVDSVEYKGKWDFWQHTDVGRVNGIEHDVDLNVFNGSLDDLKSLTIQSKVTP